MILPSRNERKGDFLSAKMASRGLLLLRHRRRWDCGIAYVKAGGAKGVARTCSLEGGMVWLGGRRILRMACIAQRLSSRSWFLTMDAAGYCNSVSDYDVGYGGGVNGTGGGERSVQCISRL